MQFSLATMSRVSAVVLLTLGALAMGDDQSLEGKVETTLALLRPADETGADMDHLLRRSLYKEDYRKAAALFLADFASFESEQKRRRLLHFSMELATEPNRGKPYRLKKIRDEELCGRWIAICASDPSEEVRLRAANYLHRLVDPALLDKHGATILQMAEKAEQIDDITILCAILPSASLQTIRTVLSSKHIDSRAVRDQRFKVDCLLTRHGDKRAEERLFAHFDSASFERISSQPGGGLEYVELVATVDFKRKLASLLRSEEMCSFGEGAPSWSLRDASALWLISLIMDEEDCPFDAHPRYDYQTKRDEIMDKLEAWCTRRFGIKYPDTPRKKLAPPVARHIVSESTGRRTP